MALLAAHNPIFSMICCLVFILCHNNFRLVQKGSNDIVQMNSTPSNDGTNACTFLPVAVADIMFILDKGDKFFARLAESLEQTIWSCPRKLTRTAMLRKTKMPWRHT